MKKMSVLVALGLAAGFAGTVAQRQANACSCRGFETWNLVYRDASPGVDRRLTGERIYFDRVHDRIHTIHSPSPDGLPSLEIMLEAK